MQVTVQLFRNGARGSLRDAQWPKSAAHMRSRRENTSPSVCQGEPRFAATRAERTASLPPLTSVLPDRLLARRGSRAPQDQQRAPQLIPARVKRLKGAWLGTTHLRSGGDYVTTWSTRVVDTAHLRLRSTSTVKTACTSCSSPPLAWRGPYRQCTDSAVRRLTFARAEKARKPSGRSRLHAERPDDRLEHLRLRLIFVVERNCGAGRSSCDLDSALPREVELLAGYQLVHLRGLASACAERSRRAGHEDGRRTAQLRSCGGQLVSPWRHRHRRFAPLAWRGTGVGPRPGGTLRLTSARTERTAPPKESNWDWSAHLRSRGQGRGERGDSRWPAGSPPLAWRRPIRLRLPARRRRLTSARARRTSAPCRGGTRWSAHLRSRGEDRRRTWRPSRTAGSPPLARRGHQGDRPGRPGTRLLSARVERTRWHIGAMRGPTAHQRSRGEDTVVEGTGKDDDGSPPLARRGPKPVLTHRRGGRLTSARAERTPGPRWCPTRTTAHLRSRGEDPAREVPHAPTAGSSPLARRGHSRASRRRTAYWLTSARAERTPQPNGSPAPGAAHLRSRGEDCSLVTGPGRCSGSPPLARRGHVRGLRAAGHGRLTSARAERTTMPRIRARQRTAHLRSRGEDAARTAARARLDGSPTLARRAPPARPAGRAAGRLTSARAESTSPRPLRPGRRSAHLRSRGEHGHQTATDATAVGPPPLARRAHGRHRRPARLPRLISARAESTAWAPLPPTGSPAHLRSRGEHAPSGAATPPGDGSPPLARRARSECVRLGLDLRLTSARAESTTRRPARLTRTAAHLRSRGEHEGTHAWDDRGDGSPPLARRARDLDRVAPARDRLTSACAERTRRATTSCAGTTAYLRSRGQDPRCPPMRNCAIGSPPLARRGHVPVRLEDGDLRLTSARAERAVCRGSGSAATPAHLRASGEDSRRRSGAATRPGSPSLARRGPSRPAVLTGLCRFFNACIGVREAVVVLQHQHRYGAQSTSRGSSGRGFVCAGGTALSVGTVIHGA